MAIHKSAKSVNVFTLKNIRLLSLHNTMIEGLHIINGFSKLNSYLYAKYCLLVSYCRVMR